MVAAFVFIFGLLIGSFLNVCIYRLPRNESLIFPASHCPACGAAIPPWCNIPVASYLLLKGRCRSCAVAISVIYPLVELLTAALGLALYLRFGLTLHFIILALLVAALVVVTFIDLEHQIIPDEISVAGIFTGFACSLFSTTYIYPITAIGLLLALSTLMILFGSLLFSIITNIYTAAPPVPSEDSEFRYDDYIKIFLTTIPGIAFCGYTLLKYPQQNWADSLLGILIGVDVIVVSILGYYFLRKEEGMGGGDIKLLAMLGAFFGWKSIPFIILVSSLVGSVIGVAVMLVQKQDGKLAIPFGPFLVIGALLHIFYGPQLVAWYFNIFSVGGVHP